MDIDELNAKWRDISDEIRDTYEQMESLRLQIYDLKIKKNKTTTESRNLYKDAIAAGYKYDTKILRWEK